jgi:hypothetical protein
MDVRGSRLAIAAAIGSLLVASIGVPTLAQDPSAGSSVAPAASGAPTQDPCARYGESATTGRSPGIASLALAQEVTAPGDDPYLCTLPAWDPGEAWPFAGRVDTEHAFYWPSSRTAVEPPGDIVGVGWVPIRLSGRQARQVRNADRFTTAGPEDRAIRSGDYMLVQIETAEVPTDGDGNRGFHLGTDTDGTRSNNVPAAVVDPDSAFQDLQNLYTLYLVAGRDAPTLASTDFGSGKTGADGSVWYNDDVRFAARVTDTPPGVQFLVRARDLGQGFRPIVIGPAGAGGARPAGIASAVGADLPRPATFAQGDEVFPDGIDVATLGTRLGLLPTDGRVDGATGGFQLDVLHGPPGLPFELSDGDGNPVTIPCLSGSPLIWGLWLTFDDLERLTAWVERQDADGDGVVDIPIRMRVRRDDTPMIQDTVVRLTLLGNRLWLGTVVCLTGYGSYEVIDIDLGEPGSDLDDVLERAMSAVPAQVPRWVVDADEGRVAGGPAIDERMMAPGEADWQTILDFFVDAFQPPPQ